MKLSLIISTFNQQESLGKVFEGVRRQKRLPDEILIADDGSDAPTRGLIKTFAENISVSVKHVWQPHEGFRKTIILNQTLVAATGDYLVFTDGDCVPIRDLLQTTRPWRRKTSGCRGGDVSSGRNMCRSFPPT